MTVLERILHLLHAHEVPYRLVHHEPTRTSEDSARVRGEPLEIGAKALVIKVGDEFRLFVLSASRRLDAKRVRKHFGVKKSRFATPDELMALTGLAPGGVPPFGRPILDLDLYVDPALLGHDRIAFNAGSLTDSVIMPVEAYRTLARPEVLLFTKSIDGGEQA